MDTAFEKARAAYGTGAYDDATLEFLFPQLKESEDERIRKELIDMIKECTNWPHKKEYLNYLEKQKENSKSADFISSDCASDAKCENRWHKTANSLPDNGREVLAKDKLGNTLLARYDGEGWDVSVYDDEDYRCHNGISKWCEIPSEKQKEHQNNSDAPEKTLGRDLTFPSDKDKNLDEIAQDYVDHVKEYNPEPTWDLIQTAVCYGYHLGANHQVLDNEHLLSAIQVKFASHAKVENGKRYAKLTWDEFKKIIFELYSCEKQKEPRHAICVTKGFGNPDGPQFELVDLQKEQKPADEQFPPLEGLDAIKAKYYDDGFKNGFDEGVASVKPAEWSEEDCIMQRALIDTLQGETTCFTTNDFISWIKFLRPSWKPSEEQMNALRRAVNKLAKSDVADSVRLSIMYDNLKKLM